MKMKNNHKLLSTCLVLASLIGSVTTAEAVVTVTEGSTQFVDPNVPSSSSSINGAGSMNVVVQAGMNAPVFVSNNPNVTVPITNQTWSNATHLGSIEIDKESDILCLLYSREINPGIEIGISESAGGATKKLNTSTATCYKGAKKYFVDGRVLTNASTGTTTISFTSMTYRA